MRYTFRNFYIPERMMDGIRLYIDRGIEPGSSFLTAIICNDLRNAIGNADDENINNIPAFISYFYNEAPSPCWGSPERMAAWQARFASEAA